MIITKATIATDRSSAIEAESTPQPYRRVPAYLIRRLQMICTAMVAEEFEDEDMPVSQWAVLTIIESHPEIDQSRLAELISFDKTNTGRLVDQLEAKGLVERRPDDSDRRGWMVCCPPLGQKIRKRLRPRGLATQDRLLSCLEPADRELFIDLMSHVVMANEKYVRP